MTAPLSYVSWRGIERHMEVQATITHGLEPARITINIPPDPDISLGGTLSIRQGNVSVNFLDCRADLVDVYKNEDGLEMWTVTILDRRWKWKFGQISGYYNVRVDKTIRKGTEKNIKQLMKLCLEAMGEKHYDLSTVPADVFPEIEWDYVLPAEALSQLADLIGFRVVFQIRRNRVAILKAGVGRSLAQKDATAYSATYDPPELPTSIVFVGGRTLWEFDLPLVAVVEETDHSIKPLNDPSVSYHPTLGRNGAPLPIQVAGVSSYWSWYDPEMGNVIGDQKISLVSGETSLKDFVKGQVYRKYRVSTSIVKQRIQDLIRGKSAKQLTLPHPNGTKCVVEELDQILPLLRERLATYPTELGVRSKPAVIYGQFDIGNASSQNNIEEQPIASSSGSLDLYGADGSPPKRLVYTGGWNLDPETGIITFSEPVFRTVQQGVQYTREDGSQYTVKDSLALPAIIWLRTSFGFRDKTTRAWKSWEIARDGDSRAKTKQQFLRRSDVPLAVCIGLGGENFPIKDATEKDYQTAAKFYLDEHQKTLKPKDPVAVTYPFIRLEDLDGAVQQVSWQITGNGAYTKVSRNREDLLLGYTWAEQRLFQQVKARLVGEPVTAAAEADKAARRPAKG